MPSPNCQESRSAFLSLTARGRHLPSSWTHFPFIAHTCHWAHPQLFPIVTGFIFCPHAPPCLVRLSIHMCVCVCICLTVLLLLSTFGFCARETSTVLPFGVSHFWILFCFLPVGLFVYIKIRTYLLLDPDPCFLQCPLLAPLQNLTSRHGSSGEAH